MAHLDRDATVAQIVTDDVPRHVHLENHVLATRFHASEGARRAGASS